MSSGNEKRWYGYINLIGITIVMFNIMGYGGTTSVYLPYMAEDTGYSVTLLNYTSMFSTIASAIGAIFVGQWMKKFSVKKVVMVGIAIVSASVIFYSMQKSLIGMFLTCFLGGWGFACTSQTGGAALIGEWFIKKRTYMIGVVYGIAGLGSAFWLYISGYFLAWWGWRGARIVSAVILLVSCGIGFLIIKNPEKLGQKPLGWEDALASKVEEDKKEENRDVLYGLTRLEALKTPCFWIFFLAICTSSILMLTFKSFLPSYWQYECGAEPLKTSLWVSVFSIITCGAQYFMGWFQQKFGNRISITLMLGAFVFACAFITRIPITRVGLIYLVLAVASLSYPTANNLGSMCTTEYFGPRDYNKIMTLFVTAIYIGFSACSPVAQIMYEKTGSFRGVYIALLVIAIGSWVLHMIAGAVSPMREINKKIKKNAL